MRSKKKRLAETEVINTNHNQTLWYFIVVTMSRHHVKCFTCNIWLTTTLWDGTSIAPILQMRKLAQEIKNCAHGHSA